MYKWSCNECETRLWSRERVPGGGSCPACGAWLPQTATRACAASAQLSWQGASVTFDAIQMVRGTRKDGDRGQPSAEIARPAGRDEASRQGRGRRDQARRRNDDADDLPAWLAMV